ncbi:MAG: chromate transporter, partial [Tissierellia bacterium]|nr:chromate transporter [Tissierellia bacterium]
MENLIKLFISFFKIGAFSFGGGYAMLPLIKEEIIDVHGWLTNTEFIDIIAISEMTPGPIAINSATFLGYKVAGVLGSVVATIAVVLPSFIVMS